MQKTGILISAFCFGFLFSQQKISGTVTDSDHVNAASVLVLNITKNVRSSSDVLGKFTVEADENDEVRFVKEGFYRTDKIINKENLNSSINIILLRAETLIPEVTIKYKPTGNLERDSRHYNDSRKVASLKSSMDAYLKTPVNVPVPINEVPKTFQPHDFNAGQADILAVIGVAVGLIKKASAPKITAPTYGETQSFLMRVKTEINLSFLTRLGMNEERIDHFLLYAERVNHLSKRFRKNFKPIEIEHELKTAFTEYAKLNKVSD